MKGELRGFYVIDGSYRKGLCCDAGRRDVCGLTWTSLRALRRIMSREFSGRVYENDFVSFDKSRSAAIARRLFDRLPGRLHCGESGIRTDARTDVQNRAESSLVSNPTRSKTPSCLTGGGGYVGKFAVKMSLSIFFMLGMKQS